MKEALSDPGVRIVLQAVAGGLMLLSGLIQLASADGRTVRILLAAAVMGGSLFVIVAAVCAHRRAE